jgi:hypothetical protein
MLQCIKWLEEGFRTPSQRESKMGRIPRKIEGNGSPVNHLWEVHKEIARLQVSGLRPVEISKRLGYTQAWLSTIMCSPIYVSYLSKLSNRADDSAIDIKKRIQEGAETGVMELLKVLKGDGIYKDSVPTSLKVKVAQDFLDRNGQGKINKVEQHSTITVLDESKIEELKNRRAAMLRNLHQPIEIAHVIEAGR